MQQLAGLGRQRPGMTVIELLVATSLAAMLSVVALGLLRTLTEQEQALRAETTEQSWHASLTEQIRWDLVNGERLKTASRETRIWGHAARDFGTGIVTHRPSEVIYRVRNMGGRNWLTRTEIHLDSRTSHSSRTELLCADVARLEVQSLEEGVSETEPDQASDGLQIPGHLRVVVYGDADRSPLIDSEVWVR